MSNQPSYEECKNYEECKKVALDRLKDAIVLFKGERYTATLYMVGYVIEIAIKAEFFRIANKEISFDREQLKKIIKHLVTEKASQNKSVIKWLSSTFSFPPTNLYELFVFFGKIAELHSSVKETPVFTVITQNRYSKTEKGFHDIEKFLEALKGWKEILGEEGFDSKIYNLKNWKVEIRYSYLSETTLEDAKEALEKSVNFLKDVLKLGNELVQIREELEFTNKKHGFTNEDKTE
ncbi:hypothetical protein [Candidatus Parabeggiatoa sp. HSG14]|uniref:hypothetical protein n=1 Tax=Candidatus Parabeggiatoa sp. HSG14 TaxID=3055593 RepID=UPI0025A69140|nr:hypothetical protein [Thiotrichales bacterium HSG14]